MRQFGPKFFFLASLFLVGISVSAQETEERVVDEVVAQVNDGVITLSRVKREVKSIVDAQVQEGKPREEAQKLVDERRGELIANLINEELLIQKAKELGLDSEIEATLNQRFLQIMKENNYKTLDVLYAEMEKTGVNREEIRELWRKQATRDMVLQKEVQSKVYWEPQAAELKAYFEKNKARFTKPETVSVSEIFLSFAGNTEAAVREKAKLLVSQLRGGADFNKLVVENSDRPNATQTKGKVDTLTIKELDPKYAAAIKNVKLGGYSDPIEVDQVGINILRVDERSQASSESFYNENAVRLAILTEKEPEARKKFMSTVRGNSYIKINENYRAQVAPILFAEERKSTTDNKQ
ncbi:MAG: peptidyl-prolyl cis-trans isomerase [Pyrinomonadaceae bacterium]